jgi:hypothetical protein
MATDLTFTATRETIERIVSGEKRHEYRADSEYYAQRFLEIDRRGNITGVKKIKTITLHDRHGSMVQFLVDDLYFCTFEQTPLPDELSELSGDKTFTGCYVIDIGPIINKSL